MRPCEHDGDKQTAFEVYQEALAQENMPLHLDLFNTLISVCTRAKDFAAAENIFDEMREKVCLSSFVRTGRAALGSCRSPTFCHGISSATGSETKECHLSQVHLRLLPAASAGQGVSNAPQHGEGMACA